LKYLVGGGYRNHPLVRLTLGGALLLLVGFWISTALMYFFRMGLSSESVIRYYRGSEAEFIEPRTYGSMLEVTHSHLAMMALVALLLTHLAIFVPWPMRWRVALIVLTFASALAGEVSGWLVRFVSPAWAPLKIGSFLSLEVCLAVLLTGLAAFLFRPAPASPAPVIPIGDSPTD
jgi:hypothetical protein